jgi:hypothetical protein
MEEPRKTKQAVQYNVYELLKTGYKGTCTQIAARTRKNKGSVSSALVQMRNRGLVKKADGTSPYIYSINDGTKRQPVEKKAAVTHNPKKVNTTVLVEGSAEVEVNEKEILIKISR